MTEDLKTIILSKDINCIFFKHQWHYSQNINSDFNFTYKGDLADYYLKVKYYDERFYFEYILDFQLLENKIFEMLKIINFINKKNRNGYFYYDFGDNKIKFKTINNFTDKLNKYKIAQIFDTTLYFTNILFQKFAFATHNLIYGEITNNNFLELLFSKIEGNA